MNHHQGVDGFDIIAHVPDANDISKNVKEILEKKNEEKIKVLLSSGKTIHMNASEFEKESKANFERCYKTLAQKDPLMIPWKIQDSKFKRIINTMKHWCKDTNEGYNKIKGLVLHSFSILEHAHGHGFTKEMLRDDMKIEKFSEKPIILVYNPHERALLLLRKAESEKLATDIELASNDLKLFILLFHDILANSRMKVIPLVVIDEDVNACNFQCHQCMNHVLSEKAFTDIGTFDNWWIDRSSVFGTGFKENLDESVSEKFLAKLTGVLSVALLIPDYIPKFTEEHNSYEHVEQLKVLLTYEQLDIYYSEQKHMVIKGGFGCGKSIIAVAMLQKISENLKEDEKLYYVCYEPRSELLNNMETKNLRKVVSFTNKEKFRLSEIIEYITKREGPGRINIIVDEYDGEDLDELEARKMNRYIKELFKEASLVLIMQAIEKTRVINKITQKKNRFDLLEETMGKPRCLTWNIRNTEGIHKLIEATKKILGPVKTNFIHPEENKTGDQLDSIKESVGENSTTSGFVSAKEDSKELEFRGKQLEEDTGNFQMALEEAHAVVASTMVNKTGVNETVSELSYTKLQGIGHNMPTKAPLLFEIGDKEEFEKHLSLLVIFNSVLDTYHKLVVLHFDTLTNAVPSALRFLFDHYSHKMKITTSYKEFKSAKKSILACPLV